MCLKRVNALSLVILNLKTQDLDAKIEGVLDRLVDKKVCADWSAGVSESCARARPPRCYCVLIY